MLSNNTCGTAHLFVAPAYCVVVGGCLLKPVCSAEPGTPAVGTAGMLPQQGASAPAHQVVVCLFLPLPVRPREVAFRCGCAYGAVAQTLHGACCGCSVIPCDGDSTPPLTQQREVLLR